MGIIARIYDFVAGTRIKSAEVDAELNQLVVGHNDHDTKITNIQAGSGLTDGSVITSKLADGSVTTIKLANSNVTTPKIADANVTTVKLADQAVTLAKIDPSLLGGAYDVGARVALNKMRIDVSETPYSAIGGGLNETTKIQAAINAAIAAGSKSIFFPSGVYSATSLTGLSNVTLYGNNATLTVGGVDTALKQFGGSGDSGFLYNRALNGDTVPLDSLKNAISAIRKTGILKVAFIGDSITETGDLSNQEDIYANRVLASLAKALPNVTITSTNFALGARWLALYNDSNYKGLASEPVAVADGFYRSWSTVGTSWKASVEAFQPDLVILAFGMNDAFGNNPIIDVTFYDGLTAALTNINTWSSKPSVVLVTTILPTTDATLYSQSQDSTNSVVRATRLFAKNNNLAVADASRLYRILRDGMDDLTRASDSEKYWVNYATDWTGSTSGYSLASNILTPSTGGFITRPRDFYNGDITVYVKPLSNATIAEIRYRDSALGNFTVYVGSGAGSTGFIRLYTYEVLTGYVQLQEVTGLTIASGVAVKIKIVAKDGNHKIYVADVLQINQDSYTNLHDGNVIMGSVISPFATLSLLNINYQDSAYETPLYKESDLLGLHVSPYDEGNGVNHPSPLGHALFYLSAFNNIIKILAQGNEINSNAYSGMARQAAKNANMVVAQEGTSFVNPANSTYTLEMYVSAFGLGGGTNPTTITHTQDDLTNGELYGSDYAYKLAWNGAGSGFGVSSNYRVFQRMENGTRNLAGANKKVTVSFLAKSDISNKKIAAGLRQSYGSGGSPTASEALTPTSSTVRTLTSAWSLYSFTFTTNTLSGKTFGTNKDDHLEFAIFYMWGTTIATDNLGGGSAESFVGSGYVSFTQLVVNAGAFALPFEPLEPERDLMQCQRYFEKSFEQSDTPADLITAGLISWRGLGGSYDSVIIPFKVTKRTIPTVLFYNPIASSASKIRNDSAATNLAAAGDVSSNSVTIYPNGVVTAAGNILKTQYTANARL